MPPALPPARYLQLPGRGHTWVYDSGPPPAPEAGPPVLLLHGWTTTAALNFHTCFPELAQRYRVVAFDQRGHGRGLRSRAPFRLEDCADDAGEVARELGLGPCTVVGYSMGGAVAQLMWLRQREMVDGLVLCATAAQLSGAQFNPAVGMLGAAVATGLSYLPRFVRRHGMAWATGRWMTGAGAAAWAAEEWSRHEPAALIQAGLANQRFDVRHWTGQIDVPTAVVITESDTLVSPRRQRYLADTIPGAVAFPIDAGHRAVGDEPEVFVPALLSALESVRGRGLRPAFSG